MNDLETVRRFHRAVTRAIAASGYLGRPRSPGASRLLSEIGAGGAELRELRDRLGLDSGYLSRLLRVLERGRLIRVVSVPEDARARRVLPTERGRKEQRLLDRLSDAAVQQLLNGLPRGKREELLAAMQTVDRLLTARAVEVELADVRDPRAQAALRAYFSELAERFSDGFDPGEGAAGEEFAPPQGAFLLASLYGAGIGCGAVRFYVDYAEIKRMWVDPAYRGCGIGSRVLEMLERFARDNGRRVVRLDTNGTLKSAQALYERSGYRRIERYNDNPYAELWYEKKIRPE